MEEPILLRIVFFSLWALLAIIRGYYYRKNPEKEKTPLRERLNNLAKAEGIKAFILTAIGIPLFVAALILYILAPPDGLG